MRDLAWQLYKKLKIENKINAELKDKYSITGDILSFQLCPRQYGFFNIRGYQPAHVVQMWFGTILHQVLDKLHLHYKGLIDPRLKGSIPSDVELELYFNQVESSLKAKGMKAINKDIRVLALKVLKIFNHLEGPSLYPNVLDTECKLQTDKGDYILHGVVDVLKDVSFFGKKLKNYDPVEIWDYKGSRYPDISTREGKRKLLDYEFQMLVYAELYKQKKGNYPLKGKIYFMNELDLDPEPTKTPTQAISEIDFRSITYLEKINQANEVFDQIVKKIVECKQKDSWDPPKEIPDKDTCTICDLRWNCAIVNGQYSMRFP